MYYTHDEIMEMTKIQAGYDFHPRTLPGIGAKALADATRYTPPPPAPSFTEENHYPGGIPLHDYDNAYNGSPVQWAVPAKKEEKDKDKPGLGWRVFKGLVWGAGALLAIAAF